MHTLVIKNAVLEKHPWTAISLVRAFQRAKEICYARNSDPRSFALVWVQDLLHEQREIFGSDPWPYNLEDNRKALEAVIRYEYEQGMTSDEQEVAAANERFYGAFESLDIHKMESVWASDTEIQCGHPGWRILRGWKPVMESWRRIFENTPAIRFMLSDLAIEVRGDLAWVTLYENLNSSLEGQNVAATVLTTNIFRKGTDGWRMIHHHGSSVAEAAPQDETPTVH